MANPREIGGNDAQIPFGWREVDYSKRVGLALHNGEKLLGGQPGVIIEKIPKFRVWPISKVN